jgi:HPt (histidine-containing phosphotransfer) domain-containing protein
LKHIDLLAQDIGKNATRKLFTLFQDELKDNHKTLLTHLTNKEWKKAARIAHHLKATARICASDNLVEYYESISQQEACIKVNSVIFLQLLTKEIQQVENDITVFLEGTK